MDPLNGLCVYLSSLYGLHSVPYKEINVYEHNRSQVSVKEFHRMIRSKAFNVPIQRHPYVHFKTIENLHF